MTSESDQPVQTPPPETEGAGRKPTERPINPPDSDMPEERPAS